jgi:hypothetical protein
MSLSRAWVWALELDLFNRRARALGCFLSSRTRAWAVFCRAELEPGLFFGELELGFLFVEPEPSPNSLGSGSARSFNTPSGSHTRGRVLAHKAVRMGYYWPRMYAGSVEVVQKCKKCQQFASVPSIPPEELTLISSPWPFVQ